MRIEPLGDSALLVRVVEEFDPETSLDAVWQAVHVLELAAIPGVIEMVPAYTTVGIFFDPMGIVSDEGGMSACEALANKIERTLQNVLNPAPFKIAGAPILQVPVCYDDEFSPDLDDVARNAGLSRDEVVHRHSGATYRVACVGFAPGFPYLAGLPAELAMPRRAVPRKEIPSGAVAIGGSQTGIYPRRSPGGWNIIGRTPLHLFDVQRNRPALFQTGGEVRFRKISRDEFKELSG